MIGFIVLEGKFTICLYMIAINLHLYYAAQFSSCKKENPCKTRKIFTEKCEPLNFLSSHIYRFYDSNQNLHALYRVLSVTSRQAVGAQEPHEAWATVA